MNAEHFKELVHGSARKVLPGAVKTDVRLAIHADWYEVKIKIGEGDSSLILGFSVDSQSVCDFSYELESEAMSAIIDVEMKEVLRRATGVYENLKAFLGDKTQLSS